LGIKIHAGFVLNINTKHAEQVRSYLGISIPNVFERIVIVIAIVNVINKVTCAGSRYIF